MRNIYRTLADLCVGWSLWSKDIIILITSDSKAGPQAWVDAYHNENSVPAVEPLPMKSGALQGVVVVDNALNHRFESLHIVYDGINGQLPNLDLFNSATAIASGQMGISVVLQRMWKHGDSYRERLQTMLRSMVSQGLGHSSGPHSSFIPYHIDAITLQAVGDGWQDEMAMGRCVESTFRSLNNLLEKFHQSFFFYLLMQANRFVSIGTYLPSAMLVAVNFSIMAIALWIRSGRSTAPKLGSTDGKDERKAKVEVEVIEQDGMLAVAPKQSLVIVERELFLPLALVIAFHFLGVIPLYTFNNSTQDVSILFRPASFIMLTLIGCFLDLQHICSSKCYLTESSGGVAIISNSTDRAAKAPPAVLLALTARHVSRHLSNPQLLARLPHRPPCYSPLIYGTTFLHDAF